jgi:hypothetical protein
MSVIFIALAQSVNSLCHPAIMQLDYNWWGHQKKSMGHVKICLGSTTTTINLRGGLLPSFKMENIRKAPSIVPSQMSKSGRSLFKVRMRELIGNPRAPLFHSFRPLMVELGSWSQPTPQ